MQCDPAPAAASSSSSSSSSTILKARNINRPTTWFGASSGKNAKSGSKGSTRLATTAEDFVMISPVRAHAQIAPPTPASRFASQEMGQDDSSSSPVEDSPTPACGVASATARLKLVDDDSPIRRVPGHSRSLSKEDRGRGVFLSAERGGRASPTSPLKYSSNNLFSTGGPIIEDDETSPQLPPTPLMPNTPMPQPLFPPLRTSQSQDCDASKEDEHKIVKLSTSHPIRARSSTESQRPMLGQKKAISLDAIHKSAADNDAFGSHPQPSFLGKKSRPPSMSGAPGSAFRAHKRHNSGEHHSLGSISRSTGQKSGLALSLTPSPGLGALPDFASNSSLSSVSTTLTPPASAFSPSEPPIFDNVKPLAEAFEHPAGTVLRKFKPRDSGVSMGDDDKPSPALKPIPPPSVMKPPPLGRPKRPAMLKRTSSMGDERAPACQTPNVTGPSMASGWPAPAENTNAFNFLGESGVALALNKGESKPSMPDTPVKRHAYGHSRTGSRGASLGGLPISGIKPVDHSLSHPTLPSEEDFKKMASIDEKRPTDTGSSMQPPPTTRKPSAKSANIPAVTLTMVSSPGSNNAMDTDASSPTVRIAPGLVPQDSGNLSVEPSPSKSTGSQSRVGLLRRLSNGVGSSDGSEDEGTPTKNGGKGMSLAPGNSDITPTPTPGKPKASSSSSIMPRLSLPAFAAPKVHKTLHHRQSHPAPNVHVEEEDLFEARFITLDTLGKGAFSTVLKVQDRTGDGLYAVKKARGVFDGVKDRLRHLEEVDILRHLSRKPCPHVIKFEDAWEQNRQLFIQTELCLGSLAFFLEEYGRVVERLDEGRVWKIIRELSDGINHIHSSGVIHFDIKPANILISSTGSLKIGDFGLATRWPRLSSEEILKGSGLGGSATPGYGMEDKQEKLEREGDRVYMPPEMLRGVFVQAADIFSFGLVILEVSTNICVPDGGGPWQALRTNDFSVVDLSPLSPALTDLIVQCMAAEPSARPPIGQIVGHPIVQRARSGKDALAPEDPRWLVDVLSGGSGFGFVPTLGVQSQRTGMDVDGVNPDGDVEMSD